MTAGEEFTRVYDRGPLALHALRAEIGDDAFFRLLKEWPATYGGKNASFDELETYVNTLAGRDMTPFMDAWFRGTTVPARSSAIPAIWATDGRIHRRRAVSGVDQPRWHPWVLAKGANAVINTGDCAASALRPNVGRSGGRPVSRRSAGAAR